ncbi:MAG: STAS domain-containing protein [Candidatus Krumholzibacteriia bacterium]|nr:STAS domain-containing protein [bacterium]MCB9513878.1 STAS domain-containing protein [Candidatus Latescibacterota bacterium]MCB9517118.1 STAS domain-containing protein [Candidatus Latescibacterota bacterium]
MPSPSLRVEVERPGADVALLRLHGRLAGPTASRRLTDVAHTLPVAVRRVVLDMNGVEYMDGAGVGSVAQLCCAARGAGHRLVLAGMNPRVKRILDASGFLPMVELADSADGALAASQGASQAPVARG